jgi:hypothetical protein
VNYEVAKAVGIKNKHKIIYRARVKLGVYIININFGKNDMLSWQQLEGRKTHV